MNYRFWSGLLLLVACISVLLTVTFAENLVQFRYLLTSAINIALSTSSVMVIDVLLSSSISLSPSQFY